MLRSKMDGGKSQDPELLDAFLGFDLLLLIFCLPLSFILIHLLILILDVESECFQWNRRGIRVQVHLCCHSSEMTKANFKYCGILS